MENLSDVKPALTGQTTGGPGATKGITETVITTDVLHTMLSEMMNGIRSEFKNDIQTLKNLITASPSFTFPLFLSVIALQNLPVLE